MMHELTRKQCLKSSKNLSERFGLTESLFITVKDLDDANQEWLAEKAREINSKIPRSANYDLDSLAKEISVTDVLGLREESLEDKIRDFCNDHSQSGFLDSVHDEEQFISELSQIAEDHKK